MSIYQFRCTKCNVVFDIVQEINESHVAFHCNKQAMRIWTVPYTNKDLMYQFTTTAFGKPQVIHSRRQYKKLLKKHGCADATLSECLSVKPKDNSKEKANKIAKEVKDEIYAKGAMPWVTKGSKTEGEEKATIEKIKKEIKVGGG